MKIQTIERDTIWVEIDAEKMDELRLLANKITDETKNTWQENRSREGKFNDTLLGKIAEKAVELYFESRSMIYKSYDSFRTDNYKKHAPIDGVFLSSSKNLDEIANIINKDVKSNDFGKIEDSTRSKLLALGARTVEVKSTRIHSRHKWDLKNLGQSIDNILNSDDFLTYPKFVRTIHPDEVNNPADYIKKVHSKNEKLKWVSDCNWRRVNGLSMDDIFIRVYVDNNNAYIIGFMEKDIFQSGMQFKQMPQKGKSENALYLAVSLKNRKPMKDLS